VPGGHASSPTPVALTPLRVGVSRCDRSTRASAGPCWLGAASARLDTHSRVSPPDAFTRLFASVSRRRRHATHLRFGVSFARDRPAGSRINRPAKALRAGPVFSFSHTTGPTRPVPRTRAEHDVTTVSRRCRAPLLRFPSPSAFAGHARVLVRPEAASLLKTIPLRPFVTSGPRLSISRTCRRDARPCGFSL
jgi:hypothetical protein